MIEAITNWDFSVLDFIQATMKCPTLDQISLIVNILLYFGCAVWVVTAVIFFFFRKTRATGIMMCVSLIFVYLITQLGIKNLVCRPRPFEIRNVGNVVLDYAHAHGYSFPSGHTACSFACATILFMRNKKVMWIMFIVAAFFGFTRLYMYVHYPTDVIAGAVFGVIIALMVYYFFRLSGLAAKIDGTDKSAHYRKDNKNNGRTKNRKSV